MEKMSLTPIRKNALLKLTILLPILLYLSSNSWCSLLIFLSIWAYCLWGALYGREENIGNSTLMKTKTLGDLSDGNLGYGSIGSRNKALGL